jgi:hypothetical protein
VLLRDGFERKKNREYEPLEFFSDLHVTFEAKAALANIIKVGSSAGGARAKAVIAWNPKTDEVRGGHYDVVLPAPGGERPGTLYDQAL